MKSRMYFFQPRTIYMRIDLSRRDIGVPEHLLNDTEIGASRQKVCRKTVAKRMGTNANRCSGS